MQKHLFLTSSVHAVAHDLVDKISTAQRKLVFITTPAEPEYGSDMQWLKDDRQALVNAGFDITDYTITNKTNEQVKADLENYDILYISGGDTLYMLQMSHLCGFIEYIREQVLVKGKIYISTSAGSILAGPKPHDYLLTGEDTQELLKKSGFNLVNFLVLPHWGSEYFKDLYFRGRLEIAYTPDQLPMVVLTDNQYVWVKGDEMQIINLNVDTSNIK